MAKGTIDAGGWRVWLLAFTMVAAILVCAGLLVFADLNKMERVLAQVGSAVAGAVLGNVVRLDISRSVVRNQARPAIRRLFDQASRLGVLVQRVDQHQELVQQDALDHPRVADWLEILGRDLRNEINATATAIDDWGDLAKDVHENEATQYATRDQRMPFGPGTKEDGGR